MMEKASFQEILLHPGIFLILSSAILYIFRYFKIFNMLAVFLPVIAAIICSAQPESVYYNFYEIWQFSFQYNYYNKIACLCILLCSSCINLSAWKNQHCSNFSVIIAMLYTGISIISMLSVDFSTMVYSLEFASLAAVLMIYNKTNESQIETAYQYLIVHSLSIMLILAGSSIIISSYGLPIINLAKLIQDFEYNSYLTLAAIIILLGLLINIACPIFSYWLVDSYSISKTTGSVYLSMLTTTINLIWIFKLFLGLKILIIIGIFITAFGIIYSILENEIKRSFSYSSIAKTGIILVMLGIYEHNTDYNALSNYNQEAVLMFLCISYIPCQCVIMLICGWLKDKYTLTSFTDFSNKMVTIDPVLLIAIGYSLALFFATPFTTFYYTNVLALKNNNIIYFLNIIMATQLLCIPLTSICKNVRIIKFSQVYGIDGTKYINIAEYIAIICFITINLILYFYIADFTYLLQQLTIITAGLIANYVSCPTKISGKILLPENIIYHKVCNFIDLYSNKFFSWQSKLQFPKILRLSNNLELSNSLTIVATILILLTIIIIDII
ncbi:proton-conducting transporter membrane subunit [Orientia tsutsugamushi]|nr:proton-conducting transporter membrane subunit [Orientia tsutsugamushi]